MTRILLTGASGQLGTELRRVNWPSETELVTPSRESMDLARPDQLLEQIVELRPDAICNSAAYTQVDQAESEIALTWTLNADAPAAMSAAARRLSIPFVHISTDYVFGDGQGPWREGDKAAPTSVYGASKRAGEIAVLSAWEQAVVIRTAWVVSPWRSNFVKTMLRLANEHEELRVVGDQRGCPTIARDLANAVQTVLLRQLANPGSPAGVFHFVNAGEASWAELADAVMADAALHNLPTARVTAITTAEFPTVVRRPADSRLATDRLTECYGIVPRPWRHALAQIMAEIALQGGPTT